MKILITGITGRIGANVASCLKGAGHDIRGLVWPKDPRIEKLEPLGTELVEGSLTDPDDVNRVVMGVDAIYHLGAAFQGGGPFSESDYFDINIRGTFNVLEAARSNDKLQHLIFASTDAQYAKYPPEGLGDPIRFKCISQCAHHRILPHKIRKSFGAVFAGKDLVTCCVL